MIIKTKSEFEIIDYVVAVEAIASEYFDENGDYTPHIGLLNAMRIFYNDYVTETDIDVPHDIDNATSMEVFVNDPEFINAFNSAIRGDGNARLDFANAYKDALDIVATKKNSIATALVSVRKSLVGIAEQLVATLGDDNIEKMSQIAQEISSGKLSNQSIVDAVGNSDLIKQIAEQAK